MLLPLGVATVVAVVALWAQHLSVATFREFDTAADSVGLITGLLSSDLMLLQVILLARVPWIERSWGHDVLVRRHRWLGLASFWLLVAHILAYVVQRTDRAGDAGAQLLRLFVLDPWMLWASLGTVLILIVVVTSIRAARRRLRYESWHLLHLYAYLGMAFALPHQIVDGADFRAPAVQVYWWGLWGVALAATLIFRIGLPIGRTMRHRLRVDRVVRESPGVISVEMTGRRLDRMGTRSGQFFVWRFLDGPGWTRGHPYTISAAPRDDRLRITIRTDGDGGERAARLRPGTRVAIEGPYGTMTEARRRHAHVLFFAAGAGVAPIRALLEDSAYAPGEATLIVRSSTEQAVLVDELEALAAARGILLIRMPGARRRDGSWLPVGDQRGDAEALRALVPGLDACDVFLCGPPDWLRAAVRAARLAGARRRDVHSENFAW